MKKRGPILDVSVMRSRWWSYSGKAYVKGATQSLVIVNATVYKGTRTFHARGMV